MFCYLLKRGIVLSKTKNRKGFPDIHLAFTPLNLGIEVGNFPFLEILDSLAKPNQMLESLMNWSFGFQEQSKEQTKPNLRVECCACFYYKFLSKAQPLEFALI